MIVSATSGPRASSPGGSSSSARALRSAATAASLRRQRLRRLAQRVHRHAVAGLGALGELLGDLDRRGAVREQDRHRLALDRPPHRRRHARERALAQQVVAERQLVAGVDEQVRADRLVEQRQQLRDVARQHRREVVGREARAEHGGDLDGVRGLGREAVAAARAGGS